MWICPPETGGSETCSISGGLYEYLATSLACPDTHTTSGRSVPIPPPTRSWMTLCFMDRKTLSQATPFAEADTVPVSDPKFSPVRSISPPVVPIFSVPVIDGGRYDNEPNPEDRTN